jgi:hypothetical protein
MHGRTLAKVLYVAWSDGGASTAAQEPLRCRAASYGVSVFRIDQNQELEPIGHPISLRVATFI